MNNKKMALTVLFAVLLGTGLGWGAPSVIYVNPDFAYNALTGNLVASVPSFTAFNISPGSTVQFVFNSTLLTGVSLQNGIINASSVPGPITSITSPPSNGLLALNTNTLLGCGGIYVAPAAYNAVVRAPGCQVNQNITITPSSQKQVFVDSAANEVITVNAIKPWNVNETCYNNWNATQTIYNTTFNAIFTCKKDSLNLTYNVTPSANATIPFTVGGKVVRLYGTQVNDTSHGVRINAFYPQANYNKQFMPGDSFNLPAANISIDAVNATAFFNLTEDQQIYDQRFESSCYKGFMSGNNFVCLQQTPTSNSLNSVCALQDILDRNVSEGLETCVLNFHATDALNYTVTSNSLTIAQQTILNNEPYNGHNATYWGEQYSTAETNRIPWNSVLAVVTIFVLCAVFLIVYAIRKGWRPTKR